MSDNISSQVEKYGSSGSMDYMKWETKAQEIKKRSQFDPNYTSLDADLKALKEDLLNTLGECLDKESTAKKVFWISILVVILGFILVGAAGAIAGNADSVDTIAYVLVFGGILVAVGTQKLWKKGIRQHIDAVIDFDKQYFDGEVMFKLKNKMPL